MAGFPFPPSELHQRQSEPDDQPQPCATKHADVHIGNDGHPDPATRRQCLAPFCEPGVPSTGNEELAQIIESGDLAEAEWGYVYFQNVADARVTAVEPIEAVIALATTYAFLISGVGSPYVRIFEICETSVEYKNLNAEERVRLDAALNATLKRLPATKWQLCQARMLLKSVCGMLSMSVLYGYAELDFFYLRELGCDTFYDEKTYRIQILPSSTGVPDAPMTVDNEALRLFISDIARMCYIDLPPASVRLRPIDIPECPKLEFHAQTIIALYPFKVKIDRYLQYASSDASTVGFENNAIPRRANHLVDESVLLQARRLARVFTPNILESIMALL